MNSDTVQSPGEFIRQLLKDREWNQVELGLILGLPPSRVTDLIKNKKTIDPELALKLAEAFAGTTAQEWLSLDANYRLSLVVDRDDGVGTRARLFELAPVNELKKRGWLPDTNDLAKIEKSMLSLLRLKSISDEPQVLGAMRKSDAHIMELSPPQRAWCCRVLQLAESVPAAPFSDDKVAPCERALRALAAYPKVINRVADVLAEHGIRFVVVEHLHGTKIDGATLWLSDSAPVIGMSLRYDRIDNFWFTLFHELSHVRHRDAASIDSDITGGDELHTSVKPPFERRADEESSASIVDPAEIKSFILRVGPLYSREKIIQFSNRMKVHPGLIVGQLHARNEFRAGYRACREMLVPIRATVISQALTDGWGQSVDLKD